MSKNQQDRLKILMQKYLNRTCSVEERNELVEMIGRTSGPHEVDPLWREVWSESDGQAHLDELSWEKLHGLSVAENSPVIEVVWRKVYRWSAVAAAVLLCIYFVSDWWMNGDSLKIYETGYGERLAIVLDDGTEVNLNADSKLYWDKDWKKEGIRQVKLEGEAYFDVSHIEFSVATQNGKKGGVTDTSSRMPFEVLTRDLTIRVLGTAFNASRRRGKTEVFLERGSVELALNRQDQYDENQNLEPSKDNMGERNPEKIKTEKDEVVHMEPGEWVSYSSGEEMLVQKTLTGPEESTEWKDGTLSYQDVEFREMLENLEDNYGKSFEVKDQELLKKRVNFSVPYKDWNTVKNMMEWMLGVEISERAENHVTIKRKGQ